MDAFDLTPARLQHFREKSAQRGIDRLVTTVVSHRPADELSCVCRTIAGDAIPCISHCVFHLLPRRIAAVLITNSNPSTNLIRRHSSRDSGSDWQLRSRSDIRAGSSYSLGLLTTRRASTGNSIANRCRALMATTWVRARCCGSVGFARRRRYYWLILVDIWAQRGNGTVFCSNDSGSAQQLWRPSPRRSSTRERLFVGGPACTTPLSLIVHPTLVAATYI